MSHQRSNGGLHGSLTLPVWADDDAVERAYASDGFFQHEDYRDPIETSCEFLVVGSGPGGATVARKLAEASRDVIVVEAGPRLTKADFGKDGLTTTGRYFWDGAARSTRGNAFLPTLHVRAVGGGSVLNSGICMRGLPDMLDRWGEIAGLNNASADHLRPHYEAVERFLQVEPQAEHTMGKRSTLLRDGCRALGYSVEALPRIMSQCRGSGECFTGCRNSGKSSLDRRGIPEVLRAGGRLYSSVHVDRVLLKNGSAVGVEGHVVHPFTHAKGPSVRIHAKCVILAAGPLATPAIALRSSIKNKQIGANLRLHPSVFAVGVFPNRVEPWKGATQGFHCTQFLNAGVKIEDVWATPGIFTVRFPAHGPALRQYLLKYPNMAVWGAWVSGEDSSGRVKLLPGGAADYQFDVGNADVRRLQEATALLTEIFLAAGADEVLARLSGYPPSLRSAEQVKRIRQGTFKISDFTVASNHVFGSMAMGAKPDSSATDQDAAVRGATDLFVADCSLLPLSPGANPMHTGMALADRLAMTLLDRY